MVKITAVLLALVLLLTGCSELRVTSIEAPEAVVLSAVAELPSIGGLLYRYDDGFLSFVRTHMDRAALGRAELALQDAQASQSKQLEQLDTMLGKGVQAVAVNLVDADAAGEVIEKAKAAELPVVFFDTEPSAELLASYDQAWYVGSNTAEAQTVLSGMIARSWKENPGYDRNGDGVMQYLLLGEDPDGRLKRSLELAGLKLELLASDSTVTNRQQAAEKVKAWLEDHKTTLEYVICTNDYLALGVTDELIKAGLYNDNGRSTIPVVGMQAIPESLDLIRQGHLQGTVLKDARSIGTAVVDLTYNVALGHDPVEGTSWQLDAAKAVRIPYVAVTKDNLEEALKTFS